MVDRQQKEEFYQQQLAQAAWANLRAGGAAAAGYGAPHAGFPAPGQPPGRAAGAAANPYQNYMMQLQQFAAGGQAASFGGGGGGPGFLGNGLEGSWGIAGRFLRNRRGREQQHKDAWMHPEQCFLDALWRLSGALWRLSGRLSVGWGGHRKLKGILEEKV